jgi:hypothetical protein
MSYAETRLAMFLRFTIVYCWSVACSTCLLIFLQVDQLKNILTFKNENQLASKNSYGLRRRACLVLTRRRS